MTYVNCDITVCDASQTCLCIEVICFNIILLGLEFNHQAVTLLCAKYSKQISSIPISVSCQNMQYSFENKIIIRLVSFIQSLFQSLEEN
jgi:hypothetical protein